jgi:hypothetical protein
LLGEVLAAGEDEEVDAAGDGFCGEPAEEEV